MGKLILIRHGKTQYNLDHRFCGLTDVSLVSDGIENAQALAALLRQYQLTQVYSSSLKRAIETAEIILQKINQSEIKIQPDQRLNERDYGLLTGKFHQEVERFFNKDEVELWRRGWDARPPEGESLADVYNRSIPFFKDKIFPQLLNPQNVVLIVAHGNSLRALISYLDSLDLDQIAKLEIVYDQPYIYEFDQNGLHKKIDKIPRQFKEMAR